MREIRFRAWDLDKKAIRDVWMIDWRADSLYQMVRMPNLELPDLEPEWANTKEHVVLMQYTGLKDKNGVEIYEGDIYKLKRFNGLEAICVVEDLQDFFEKKGYAEGELGEDWDEIEVIGNIYENPELIK